MSKFQLSSGKVKEPEFMVVYGVEGIGKTTFASQAPSPVIVDIEGGSSEIDITRISPDQLDSFDSVMESLDYLADQDFETIVIDSLSKLEQLVWAKTCRLKSVNGKSYKSIEDFAYKQGYIFALDVWSKFLDKCEQIRKTKNKNIILIGHTATKKFDDPTMSEGYTRYEIDLHAKASYLIRKNVKAIVFANYKTLVKDGKGLDTGERVIFTERRPGHDAKNRYSLPYEIMFSWNDYQDAKANANEDPEVVKRQILGMITEIGNVETREKILSVVEKETDISRLKSYLKRVETIIGEQK
jgi:hypothetical protein